MANRDNAVRRSVLVVDDDGAIAQLIAHGLRRAGMHAEIAASRTDAERRLTRSHDAIVADYVLPDGTGLDLARDLRANGDDRPIVIVTAFGSESVAREALAIPGCDYVPKSDGFACTVPLVLDRAFQHRAVRDRLLATEARTRSLVEHVPAGMYVSEGAGHIAFANRRLELLVGAEPGGLEGRRWQDLVPAEDRAALRRAVARAWGIGEPVSLEHRVVGGREGVRHVLHEAHPVFEGRRVERLEGFVVDITVRRRLVAQLKRAQRLESLGRLAGGIAHDFNNSLTGIVGFSELALLEVTDELPAHDDIRRVISIAKDATATIRKLLSFARRKKLSRQLLEVGGLLRETAQICERTFPETIHLQLDVAADLALATVDPAELVQALMNLCVNARDALGGGGVLTLRARNVEVGGAPPTCVDGLSPGPYVRLDVQDDGVGMDGATRERLFEPFFTTKPKERGTGLGLSMVYGCLRAHGGAIGVESAPGRGACFSIYLPASPGEVTATEASEPVASGGDERILVVEDEQTVREVAVRLLRALGYRVNAACGGHEALARFAAERRAFDLVLTDLVMPHGTGAELARALASVAPSLPVIVMTGYGEAELASDDLTGLQVRWAQKPLDRRRLAGLVREALDESAQLPIPRRTRLSA